MPAASYVSVQFLPDGKYFLAGTTNATAEFRDAAAKRLVNVSSTRRQRVQSAVADNAGFDDRRHLLA